MICAHCIWRQEREQSPAKSGWFRMDFQRWTRGSDQKSRSSFLQELNLTELQLLQALESRSVSEVQEPCEQPSADFRQSGKIDIKLRVFLFGWS